MVFNSTAQIELCL